MQTIAKLRKFERIVSVDKIKKILKKAREFRNSECWEVRQGEGIPPIFWPNNPLLMSTVWPADKNLDENVRKSTKMSKILA